MTKSLKPSSSSHLLLVAVLVAILTSFVVEAVPAVPSPFIEENEDGTSTGKLYLHGDERYHYITDANGYTVCPVRANGNSKKFNFNYCEETGDGDLRANANLQVGKSNPSASGLKKGLVKSKQKALEQCGVFCSSAAEGTSSAGLTRYRNLLGTDQDGSNLRHRKLQKWKSPTTKAPKLNLVILVRFSEHATRNVPTKEQIIDFMNGSAVNTVNNIKSYFLTNSNWQYNAETVVASDWILLPQTEAYYADNSAGRSDKFREAAQYALDHVDAAVNFADFDQNGDKVVDLISFFHSGNGAEWNGGDPSKIWSGRTSFSWNGIPWTSSDGGVKVDTYLMNTALWGASGDEINAINGIVHEYGTCCLFVELPHAAGCFVHCLFDRVSVTTRMLTLFCFAFKNRP